MALRLVSTRDQTAYTCTAAQGAWASWEGQSLPWCTNGGYRLILTPGRYRVESPSGFELNTNGWATQGKDALVDYQAGEIRIYANSQETGTFFITRLA